MPTPSFLSGFEIKREGEDTGVQYSLTCRPCGSDSFYVSCHVHTVTDPIEFFGYNKGDTILSPPIFLECGKCCDRQTVFDPRKHGYDAMLNSHCSYACEKGELRKTDSLHTANVALSYNVEPTEIQELAKNAGVLAEDLFDSIAIAAIPLEGGVPLIFEYECA